MSNWGMNVVGLSRTIDAFEELQTRWDGNAVYFVGSNVEYSLYVEMGTSKMAPQPYLRPSVQDWKRDPEGYISKHTNVDVGSIDSTDELVRVTALAIERDAAQRSPVDTGNLQASVTSQKIK